MDSLAAMFTQLSAAMGNPNPDLSILERARADIGSEALLGAMASMASVQVESDPLKDPEFIDQIRVARMVDAAEKAREPRRPRVADRQELIARLESQRDIIARERHNGQP